MRLCCAASNRTTVCATLTQRTFTNPSYLGTICHNNNCLTESRPPVAARTQHRSDRHLSLTRLCRPKRSVPCRASSEMGTAAETPPAEPPSYAPLHDFCMMIPYGGAALLVGVLSYFFGTGILGIATALNGALMIGLASLSLKTWKSGAASKLYTWVGFVTTSATWCLYYPFLHLRIPPLQHAIFMVWVATTSAMMLFLMVNALMGGNPPKGYVKPKQE